MLFIISPSVRFVFKSHAELLRFFSPPKKSKKRVKKNYNETMEMGHSLPWELSGIDAGSPGQLRNRWLATVSETWLGSGWATSPVRNFQSCELALCGFTLLENRFAKIQPMVPGEFRASVRSGSGSGVWRGLVSTVTCRLCAWLL